MAKCIFCLIENELEFNTKEHILPESLGGGDWAILPEGLYCDKCQNLFGSTIEQQALADYPFINLRTLIGIPTKKGKAPWFKYWEGNLHSAGQPGRIVYEPNPIFKSAFESGQKTLTIIPAMTKKPHMVLRTLLKIGLETIAANDVDEVFKSKYDAARNYAVKGTKDYPWFYIQYEDNEMLQKYLQAIQWPDHHCYMDVHYINAELTILHLRVYYLQFMVPLVENVIMDKNHPFNEPHERVVIVD